MDNPMIIESTATPVRHMTLLGVLRIPVVRQVLLLIGVAMAVAAGFAIVLWSQTPGYTQLYADLDNADAAQVAETLRAADIKYKLNMDTGSVMVPEERIHDARLQLAAQGLPAGASSSMDLMHDQTSFGVSQFMEVARYQYALEAELARTISHLGAVRDARVHLALPKQSAFIRDQKSATASVLLQLFRGRALEPDQASAIVNLVASSVPNLVVSNVTLIDQQGRLLSSGSEQLNNAETANQFKHSQRIEETYKRRIEELLTPLVGPGRVRAQVAASLDFTVTEETREVFDPSRTVIRSEQTSEEQRRGSQIRAEGVPGALSNQPPDSTAGATVNTDSTTATVEPLNTSRSSTRNFEVDRTISRIRPQSGMIKRLSVAVLIDDSPMEGVDQSDQRPLTEADIQRFTILVKETVGFDASRGDTVAVVNAAFRSLPEMAAAEEPAFWEKPILRDAIKLCVGAALVLALAFGLVRPMFRSLLTGNMVSSAQYIADGRANVVMSSAGPQMSGNLAIAGPSFDEKVAAAKNITGHDPARVAQVVKKWVTADD